MKANIKNVALRSGVSISTVSRVLNAPESVRPDTRKRVLKIIAELGYRQNLVARNLRRKSSSYVGLIIPDISNEFFSMLAKHLQNALQVHGFSLFLSDTNEDFETEQEHLNGLIDNKVCAIVVSSADIAQLEPLIAPLDIPFVLIDRFVPGSLQKDKIVCIESDNFTGAYNAAELLIKKGAKKIGFLMNEKITHPQLQRESGFIAALVKNGMTAENYRTFHLKNNSKTAAAQIGRLYSEYPFDALFCANDRIAHGAVMGLLQEGIKIPEQIMVIGYDGIELNEYVSPSISTVKQNTEKIALIAAGKIIEMVKEHKAINEHIVVPTLLVERQTTKK